MVKHKLETTEINAIKRATQNQVDKYMKEKYNFTNKEGKDIIKGYNNADKDLDVQPLTEDQLRDGHQTTFTVMMNITRLSLDIIERSNSTEDDDIEGEEIKDEKA